jgi:phosphomannomutase/phosphoglucomutase
MTDLKAKVQEVLGAMGGRHVDVKWIFLLALVAIALVVVPIVLEVSDRVRLASFERLNAEGQAAVDSITEAANTLRRVLEDPQVQTLALRALADEANMADLRQYLSGRVSGIHEVLVVPPDLDLFDAVAAGPNGFALLDMLMMASDGHSPLLQMHGTLDPPRLFDVAAVRDGNGDIAGYLAVGVEPELVLAHFGPEQFSSGYAALSQYNGRQAPTMLRRHGAPARPDAVPQRHPVGGTLFRVEQPMVYYTEFVSGSSLLSSLVIGLLTLAASVFLYRKNKEWAKLHPPAPKPRPVVEEVAVPEAEPAERLAAQAIRPSQPERAGDREAAPAMPAPVRPVAQPPGPPPMRLRYDIAERPRVKPPETRVDLTPGIFRAYDIRGIVGKTLDAGIASQVGQVLGTLALEKNAGPVVVARDGRLSGPDLATGMIEGIIASGCDVLDIGAVPTGVLYFAAFERASGTGVMITGSHNPPDYNGFKIMVAGDTLYGPQIRRIHERITEGEFRVGDGKVERANVLADYRERIASDIKLERPLRVVIDCGNGIGGVCAADVLRAIGAEVLPLFDEVDGTFPNHHPDPSDPANLQDLIESVRLMDADLGLALDGDADRLGVVTLGGTIIYPDRVMMLLAMDVLDRVPGATIIYDVKCTGHLAKVIKAAGGNPVMYKTGHSLIKAKMKELGSPFAGEMSGHFFFGERWYGVDDGIYAAARLLEILSGAEAPPEAILNALPTSYSTPELKVEMQEGQNHVFIDALQSKARFEGAKVSTIDGVRADFEDGWGLVRASNTTPILVVRFDAETEPALERIKNVFRSRMLAINPDLELPF